LCDEGAVVKIESREAGSLSGKDGPTIAASVSEPWQALGVAPRAK